MSQEKPKNGCDSLTISLLIISASLVLFSLFSPFLLTQSQQNERFDFSNTGEIGDTVGGLMTPFIGLAGILLTFLAFYMQIKANQLQSKLFYDGLEKEIQNEKEDCYYKISLLIHNLKIIEKDIEKKLEQIKDFIELENKADLSTNVLKRTVTNEYSRILSIDRVSIYKGFRFFFHEREDWVKIFGDIYGMLDYLHDYFIDIYRIADHHVADLSNRKGSIVNNIKLFINSCSDIVSNYRNTYGDRFLQYPESNLCNDSILRFYEMVNEGIDENMYPTRETDLNKIDKEVLGKFIESALLLRKNSSNWDKNLEALIKSSSDLRKEIQSAKVRMKEVANNLSHTRDTFVKDEEESVSNFTQFKKITSILESEMTKISISNRQIRE